MPKGQISDPPERVYTIPEQEALHVLKKYMDYEATLTDVAVAINAIAESQHDRLHNMGCTVDYVLYIGRKEKTEPERLRYRYRVAEDNSHLYVGVRREDVWRILEVLLENRPRTLVTEKHYDAKTAIGSAHMIEYSINGLPIAVYRETGRDGLVGSLRVKQPALNEYLNAEIDAEEEPEDMCAVCEAGKLIFES